MSVKPEKRVADGPIWVTGAGGLLGSALLRSGAAGQGRVHLDVTDTDAVERMIGTHRPRAVIHCAAFTHVDACGPEHWAVNVTAAETLAARVPTWLVSSNYVFDGPGPHSPSSPRCPCLRYGVQKAAAEDAVLAHGGHVVRTGWLFGPGGTNFPSRLPELLAAGPVQALESWPVQPTWADDLAAYLMTLPKGVTHAVGGEQTTWADFSRALAVKMGLPADRVLGVSKVKSMGPRPQDARLLGHALPGWPQRIDPLLEASRRLGEDSA